MSTRPTSPYKGLNAFEDSELDALLFFGREREREIVVANLIASRLTVLYGPSGVGKSSLLRAAVARSLRELPEEPLVVVLSSWSDNPAEALAHAVAQGNGTANGSALDALEQAQSTRDVYVVLDQAEEYFLYHADDSGPGSLAETLPALLSAPYRVNVLVSLREDSLAKLDRFAGQIPGLFANTLRLDRLDRQAARAAIVRPVERFAELTNVGVQVEPELVERVLDHVGAGQIESPLGGVGAVETGDEHARIEAPYLQLVMQRLWEEERASSSDVLRLGTLERLGGAQHIVEEHLAGAMAELTTVQKDVAARLFGHLVTPSGTKIAHEVSDLADFGQVPTDELRQVLDTLADRRILRSVEEGDEQRYEIFHDVLAQPVLAWRREHEGERELEAQKRAADRRHRVLLAVIAVGAVLFAAMGAVTVFALTQRSEAREQAREARGNELVANADANLERDPELSLLLASEAARVAPGQVAEQSLRRALLASRIRGVVDVGEPLLTAVLRRGSAVSVTESGRVVVADPRTGEIVRSTATSERVQDASFADDGTAVLTGRDGAVRVVSLGVGVARVPGVDAARAASVSPDGTLVVVVEPGGARLVERRTGRTLHTYAHPGAVSAAISSSNRRVLTGGVDQTVRVWSGQSGRRIHTLTEQAGHAVAVTFSPGGEFAASASTDGTGRIWRTSDWGLSSVLTGHTHALTDIAFSDDGQHVVTTGRDGTARVSHAESGDELFALSGHRGWATSAAFAGGAGSPVATTSPDGRLRVWDAVFQPELDELAQLPAGIVLLQVDNRLRARTGNGREHTLARGSGARLGFEAVPKRRPRRVVGPGDTSATMRGKTVILRRAGKTTVLQGHRDRVTSLAFSPAGELLASGSLDHDGRIWNVATGELVDVVQHNTAVHDVAFSPDGRWLLTATLRASLWDTNDWTNVARLQGHDGVVTAVAFDPKSRTIITGGADGTVRTYRCDVCGGVAELGALAERRLGATRRVLSDAERTRYLG